MNKINKPKYRIDYINRTTQEPDPKENIETKITRRIYNADKETYEYKEVIINHKLNWENEIQNIQEIVNNGGKIKL